MRTTFSPKSIWICCPGSVFEADGGQCSGSLLAPQRGDCPLQGTQVDLDTLAGKLLLDDDRVPLGNRAIEAMHFTERIAIEATGRRPLLKACGRSSEITADGIAGDQKRTSNPFAPESLAGQLADP